MPNNVYQHENTRNSHVYDNQSSECQVGNGEHLQVIQNDCENEEPCDMSPNSNNLLDIANLVSIIYIVL